MKRIIVFIAVLFCVCENIHAHSGNGGNAAFIENKNQWNQSVKFKLEVNGGAIFFEEKCITYVVQDRQAVDMLMQMKFGASPLLQKNAQTDSILYHAYKVHFKNAQTPSLIEGQNVYPDYNNYFLGNDPAKWASDVKKYHSIEYKNIYPNVHLTYYEENNALKYDFIVKPNGNPNDIVLEYEGVDKIFLKKGNLYILCSNNEIVEMKPFAYQQDEFGTRNEVECDFSLKGNVLTFKLGKYNTEQTLIIDPVLVFCSYSGSYADNWGYTATYDSEGNLYGGGSVFGIGYPTTTGAYQVNFKGTTCDIGISKFSSSGNALLFSTYLGGTANEVPHSLIVNENDELYILASTSSADFPVTANAYKTTFSGGGYYILTNVIAYSGIDAVICKLNPTGTTLLASTYFGGSGSDGLSVATQLRRNYADEVRGEIMTDEFSNVYIVSNTSSRDLPVSASAFQPNYGGGIQDGFIAKFTYDLSTLIWCSYLGGDSADAVYSMAIDSEYNVYVCGGTCSQDFPVTPNTLQTTYGGGISDGFIAKISTNGDQLLHSTYCGKEGYDQVYLLKLDRTNAVHVVGLTDASGNAWIQNATWYQSGGGQFIQKISPDLSSLIWSTAFGKGNSMPDISPTALMVDVCKGIYLSGWGSHYLNLGNIGVPMGGTNGLPITSDAFQSTSDNSDFYFMSISEDASRLVFGTYFGGSSSMEHVDGGTSRFDKKGVIYQSICAGCGRNQDLPVHPSATVVGPTNNSNNCNMGVVKIDFMLPSVVADFGMPNIICAPHTINFKNKSQIISSSTTKYYWDLGDGTTSSDKNPSHTYTNSGTYIVTLIVSDTGSCNFDDTLSRELIVLANSNRTLAERSICRGDFTQIGIPPASNPNISYRWYPTAGLSDSTISNPIATTLITRTYFLVITDGVCVDTLTQRVNVVPISLKTDEDRTVCKGTPFLLDATSTGFTGFIWSSNKWFSDTLNSDLSSPQKSITVNSSKTYYIKVFNNYCSLTDSIRLNESHIDLSILPTSSVLCGGVDTVILEAMVTNPEAGTNLKYTWTPTTDIISGQNSYKAIATPEKTTTFYVTVTNEHNCVASDSISIEVKSVEYDVIKKDISCFGGNDGRIEIIMAADTIPYTFIWKNNVGEKNIATELYAGDYSVKIVDEFNCSTRVDITLTQPTKISSYFFDTNALVYCNAICDGYASVAVSGGIPPYKYWWITGDTTQSIEDLCAGDYMFVATDKNACTDTSYFSVFDTTALKVLFSIKNVTCFGDCDGSIKLTPILGHEPYIYEWKYNNISTDSADSLCAGIYNIMLTDAKLCKRNLFPIVKSPDILRAKVKMVQPTCYNDTNGKLFAGATGGTPPYRFFFENEEIDSLDKLVEGEYAFKIIDAHGCETDTIIKLTQFDSLDVSCIITKVPCKEACVGTGSLSISGGDPPYTIEWDNGEKGYSAHKLCYGEHSVTITDDNGCRKVISFFVEDSSYFSQNVLAWGDTNVIYRGLSTNIHMTYFGSEYTYLWTPPDWLANPSKSSTSAAPKNTIIYTATVRDKYNCEMSDTLMITVLDVFCEDPYIYVPNAFSPNGDNSNDILYVRGILLEKMYFAVYDRWGERVFETTDQNIGWDGTFRGKACDPGVYVFHLDATCIGGENYIHKGNVTLIR